jgi:F0F1-type ATP synthase assembly protein I
MEERRRLQSGMGDAFSRAVEFVVTPAIFAFLGHLLDVRVGTGKLFLLVFGVLAAVGMMYRSFLAYSQAMEAEDAKGPWRAERGGPPAQRQMGHR